MPESTGMSPSVRRECGKCGRSVWVDRGRFQAHDNNSGNRCSGSNKKPGSEK